MRLPAASAIAWLSVPVRPGVEIVLVRPHAALRLPCFSLDAFVTVTVGGDRVSLPHQPFTDVPALVGYGAEQAPEIVRALDGDADVLTSNFLN